MSMNSHFKVIVNQRRLVRVLTCTVALALLATASVWARTKDQTNGKDGSTPVVQRDLGGAQEQQRNAVSSIDFWTTNYGIFGFNVRQGIGGTVWPRGSLNQYIFAGGAWFAAQKRMPGTNDYRKRVLITYNPNSGLSWMAPGRIEDGISLQTSTEAVQNYRTYFSTDFSASDGSDFQNPTFPKWPVWDHSPNDTLRFNNYFGDYIYNIGERSRLNSPKGPAFVSQEDVFCTYKDTDLSLYEGGPAARLSQGYPLGFQVEQTLYSWGFGDYADIMFIKYLFIHPVAYRDTLFNCWMAAVVDVDIATVGNSVNGAGNDYAKFYSADPSLNLAVQWTDTDRGESGRNFGYLGFNFLESPAVTPEGWLRKDARKFPTNEQLGMRTMRNWPITVDPIENEDRYNFMSTGVPDQDDQGAGDRRLLMATGPFNVRPGDSARIVVGLIMANTSLGKDKADGSVEDLAELVRKVKFAQSVYDNNFIAPKPPDNSAIRALNYPDQPFKFPAAGWMPLNNGIAIQWDSTAELSIDTLERGMDFLGYRVYRARRTDRDTYALDDQPNAIPKRKGPLGWRQVGAYGMGSPFYKSPDQRHPITGVYLDLMNIANPVKETDRSWFVQRFEMVQLEPWATYFDSLLKARPANYTLNVLANGLLDVSKFDKLDSIRYTTLISKDDDSLPAVNRISGGRLDTNQQKIARDSLYKLIIAGKIKEVPFLFQDTMNMPDGSVASILRPFEETSEVRHGIIASYMRRITNMRTHIDLGDDDQDGVVEFDQDAKRSERLINNVDYYYSVQAYDEGDVYQASPVKISQGTVGLQNVIIGRPQGARPGGGEAKYDVIITDENKAKLGGLYNIKLLVNEPQRFNQLFSGKTIEVDFYRSWFEFDADRKPDTKKDIYGLYGTSMVMRDSATKQILNSWGSALPPELCGNGGGFSGLFTENGLSWIDTSRVPVAIDSIKDTVGYANSQPPKDKWVNREGLQFERIRDLKKIQIRIDSALIDRWFTKDSVLFVRVRNADGTSKSIDSVTFAQPGNRDTEIRPGAYATNARCFPNKYTYGTVGLTFDYAIKQYGGLYRPLDSVEIVSGPSNFFISRSNVSEDLARYRQDTLNPVPFFYQDLNLPDPGKVPGGLSTGYNNGPGIYEIEFLEGGTENITTQFKVNNSPNDSVLENVTFENVRYLNMRVRNVLEFNRQEVQPDGSLKEVTVNSPFDYSNFTAPVITEAMREYPNPQTVPIGSFAVAGYGWRNTRSSNANSPGNASGGIRVLSANGNVERPLTTGKYYLSRAISTTGRDTLDFLHTISIAGSQWTLDWTGRNRRTAAAPAIQGVPPSTIPASSIPNRDFQPGDKIRVFTTGGAYGYPYDGARVYFKVKEYDPAIAGGEYTESQMEDVQVVPNPFYVNHEGMTTTFGAQIYFTRLPRKCKISIYTVAGDLVTTINHDETESTTPGKAGADIWNLLSRNRQRVTSQLLVAKIETPDGQSVIRKFSVVVGPARTAGESGE